MTDTRPALPARALGPLAFVGMGVIVLVAVGLTTMLCWRPANAIRDDLQRQAWTIVPARITEARVDFRHTPAIGKRSSWNGWCASWKYAYDWHGSSHWATVDDDTPSTLAPGCFSYQESAQHASARHPPGSTLPVRVDPAAPWHSSASPVDIRGSDIAALAFGLVPALIFVAGCVSGWRARPAARPGHR